MIWLERYGHDQTHVDSAAGGQREGPGQHLVRNEIRRDDPDPVAGRKHQRQQRFVQRVADDIGPAGHNLNDARLHPRAPAAWPRRVADPRRVSPGREPPIRREECLELGYRRPLDDHRQISPQVVRAGRPDIRPRQGSCRQPPRSCCRRSPACDGFSGSPDRETGCEASA